MTEKRIVKMVAFIEILIGLITMIGILTYKSLSMSTKPLNVFVFVLVTAAASFALGLGLLNQRPWARTLLIFFSGYILLTKAMIALDLLRFNGEIVTSIPAGLKNAVSILYHLFIIWLLNQRVVKKLFL
ncbi:MAG: hypothetical protein JW919_03345 [Candidatus Omnitrophica bacterium]|nr:hypothetical protein [Candidatus Omnitrophota bacterium]